MPFPEFLIEMNASKRRFDHAYERVYDAIGEDRIPDRLSQDTLVNEADHITAQVEQVTRLIRGLDPNATRRLPGHLGRE